MAAVRAAVVAKAALVAAAVVLAVGAPATAAGSSSCATFTGHQVLSAPGGVLTLSDNRQVRASIIDVGGCTTRPNWVTGQAHKDTSSNYTSVSRGTTANANNASECVTGVPTDTAGAASYTSFQAVVFEANGFRFTPSLVFEDIDAQDNAAQPSEGWRETMSSLGSAGGQLVYPQMSTAKGALVGVRRFGMPAQSLKAVGLPDVPGLSIDGAAFLAKTPKNCPFLNDPASECKAFVKYSEPIDRLVIIYAVTQRSLTDPKSVAFFSELNLTCGCQCSVKSPALNGIKVVPTSEGKCEVLPDTTTHYECDFIGDAWCNTVPSLRYTMSGTGDACERRASIIQRILSKYAPSDNFGPARVPEGEVEGLRIAP